MNVKVHIQTRCEHCDGEAYILVGEAIDANGNNIRIGGDLPRRCYPIRLDAKMSYPYQRSEFLHPNLIEWVETNRGRLLSAVLTLARAWVATGKLSHEGPIMGGFTEWVQVVGGILENAGISNFLDNLPMMYDHVDEEGRQWEAFLLALHHLHQDSWVLTRDICEDLKHYSSLVDLLPDELDLPFDYNGEVRDNFVHQLGLELRKRVETRFGASQVHIKHERDTHLGVAKWRIVCGDAGVRGVSTTQSQNFVG